MAHTLIKRLGIAAVSVMNQEAVAKVRWHRVTQLVEGPRQNEMGCRIDVQDPAGGMFHHDQQIQEAKRGRDQHTKVTRHDRPPMILTKVRQR